MTAETFPRLSLGKRAGSGLAGESGGDGDAADDRLELPHVPLERRRRGHHLTLQIEYNSNIKVIRIEF